MSTVARLEVPSARAGATRKPPSIDPRKYRRLLGEAAPVVIETEEEYRRMLARFERLMDKDDDSISSEGGCLLKFPCDAPGGLRGPEHSSSRHQARQDGAASAH